MSAWHNADDFDIDHSRKEVDFLVTHDYAGNIYLSVSFEQIKDIYERILKEAE